MRSDFSDAPSPELPSTASTSSTLSSGRREHLSSSPAAHHLHFASDVFPSSLSSGGLQPSGSQSTGRRTPQPRLPPQRRTSRTISADPLLSPQDRRASLATSTAYMTAPSTITARRTSMGRMRSGRPIKKEDAEIWEFGENAPNPALIASSSSRKGLNAPEDEQLQQRLARIDMDLVMQALQEQSTPARPEFGLSTSSSSAPISTPPNLSSTHRSSSFATTSSPLRVEDLRLPSAGSPDSSTKEKRKRMRILSLTRKSKEKLSPEEEQERLKLLELQRMERIRHIHSTLTQSTLSRAESAKHQFEARYVYLLSAPPLHNGRPPTFLDVVKWKRSMREIDRLKRRHESRIALSRGQSLSRMTTNDSTGEPGAKSVGSSPNTGSRRESFNATTQPGVSPSFSTDTVSHWAEQLILSKHRRKRSVLGSSTAALSWDSVGLIGKASDWDLTAQDIMEYLACQGTVEAFVPPVEQEREVRSSEERESMDLEKILRRTVGAPGTDKSAPPSLMSLTSADDSAAEVHASPAAARGRTGTHVSVIPPTTGKRQLSLVTEAEPESATDGNASTAKRRARLLSAPESPVSGREDQPAGAQAPRFHRAHSVGVGRGSISQAFGSLLNLSGSAAGSQEAFTASGVASSRQSVSGKKWTPGRLRHSLDEGRDKSPDGSASENPLSAVNSDNDLGSGTDLPWRRSGAKNKKKRKIPALTFNRRGLAAEAEKGPDESVLSLPTPGPTDKIPKLVLPNVPGFEKDEEEDPEESVDSEEEAAEYERKARVLERVKMQVARMDNILASSRIKHLAQELLDMRAATLNMHPTVPVVLPPLPEDLPLPTIRPRLQDPSGPHQTQPDLRPADHHVISSLRGALPRTVSEPLPNPDDEDETSHEHARSRAMTVSRSASLPQPDVSSTDLVPHLQEALDHLSTQWKEVDSRLDALFAQQQAAFQLHARMQAAIEHAQAQYFAESQVMDRLDDRIHRLKTRNLGNSWLFTFLAGLAEVLLFFVWLVAKIIQLVFFRIPKLAWRAVVRLFVFLWWLVRWVLFLDYLWP